MNEPIVELDERFSDSDARATPWEEARRALESAELFWISTVRADGRPHVTPLVAVWHESALYFSTGPEEQKAVNLTNNAHVVLTTGCNDWQGGLDVMVEGRAARVTENVTLELLARIWAAKWDGRWKFGICQGGFRHSVGGFAHVYGVAPTKVLAFRKGMFSHTRYAPFHT